MTLKTDLALSLATLACVASMSVAASAQTAATRPQASSLSAEPASTTTTPAAPAAPTSAPPVAAPVPPPAASPYPVVPPGYALVPMDGNGAQTRYDVEYPQQQGALPPGMELPYEDGDPVPAGYRLVKRPRRGLVIAGSIVGGIGYGFGILGATSADFEHKSGALMVPVLGPWLMMALGGAKDEPCTYGTYGTYSSDCGSKAGLRTLLVLDGMMQAAGATMLIVGLAVPTTRIIRKDVTVSFAPMSLGKEGYGLGAIGQF